MLLAVVVAVVFCMVIVLAKALDSPVSLVIHGTRVSGICHGVPLSLVNRDVPVSAVTESEVNVVLYVAAVVAVVVVMMWMLVVFATIVVLIDVAVCRVALNVPVPLTRWYEYN